MEYGFRDVSFSCPLLHRIQDQFHIVTVGDLPSDNLIVKEILDRGQVIKMGAIRDISNIGVLSGWLPYAP